MVMKTRMSGLDANGIEREVSAITNADGTTSINTVNTVIPTVYHSDYSDATYEYFFSAPHGSAITDLVWTGYRREIVTGNVQWAGGATVSTTNAITNLATVQGLTYNNGVAT